MDSKMRLFLAWAIGEWDAALRHLHVLATHGDPIAEREAKRVKRELTHLTLQWRIGSPVATPLVLEEVIGEAREHCTANLDRLEALLKERQKSDQSQGLIESEVR